MELMQRREPGDQFAKLVLLPPVVSA